MDSEEFLEMVEGALLWFEESIDIQLDQQAWYTANMMMATGNMKKGTKVLELKDNLYKSVTAVDELSSKEKMKAKAEQERAKLRERFNL